MPPVCKPEQQNEKGRRLGKTLESEDELAMQSSRVTRSQRAAPKGQPSLPASNRPTHTNAGNPNKPNPATYRTSADALDQLSNTQIQLTPSSTYYPREKSQSPARAPSPSKQSSVDESQNSRGSRTATKKESLALMNPPIVFSSFSAITQPGRSLPPLAHALWMDHIRSACSSAAPYIPNTLKARLREDSPRSRPTLFVRQRDTSRSLYSERRLDHSLTTPRTMKQSLE
ncbi:MAG: hypothetical protein Q9207_006263 [Kuettlingeria erythrocarpa]